MKTVTDIKIKNAKINRHKFKTVIVYDVVCICVSSLVFEF